MRWLVALLILVWAGAAMAAIKTQEVKYNAGDTDMKGVLLYNDELVGKTPCVIVFPEWWGLNDYARARGRMLAELGYVAFVADVYGGGKNTDDAKEAQAWAGSVYSDPDVLLTRITAAYEQARNSPLADSDRIAAIGYCMGGGLALNLARSGADLKSVVGFHCGLASRLRSPKPITAHVLVCNGADDPTLNDKEFKAFEDEMRATKVDWQYVLYGNALHAFTNPAADKHRDLGVVAYNQEADLRSWRLMRDHLAHTLNFSPPATVQKRVTP